LRVTQVRGYYTISCRLAAKILRDGRNAHLIVQPWRWWQTQLNQYFNIVEHMYEPGDQNYRVVVEPKEPQDITWDDLDD
jgi:hypothetical protein